ncbi:pentatricopeptide repeat-containing protein At1g62680, mitochondrial-like [Nicotiana sylvestris]|uniref:Pentatricopeptide repeat-containing protein At1g63150-like n=2 Tax=Nicotiana TaxID=4085 RepID=A0A1S4D4S5_TOBAC|nr:PREDICTED: pentatricopeptide repeat-containing protein At1g63150-like [Nicotiana sylvestris]XP_016508412.1 PREDICTED: pentatricopeptide repeat-containing protein At1g63150-like [Nicotiana tabacum]
MPSLIISPSQQHSLFSISPLISTVQPLLNITLKPLHRTHIDFAPIKTQSSCSLHLDNKGTVNSQWQDILEAIKASSTLQNLEISRIIEQNGGFKTISDFNHLLISLVLADEFELALKLSSLSYALAPDGNTYSIWVSLYCKKNDPETAKSILGNMLKDGFQPKVATFTTLINTFCKGGKLQKAYEVFEVMGQIGCEPTIYTYNCLLKGLCFVGRVEEAYELLLNIKKSNKKPDLYTYTAVMDGFCKVGRSNEALELLEEALEMGLIPNVVTYNTLFNGYFKEGRPLDGIKLLKKMKKQNCVPDHITYSTLLHGLLKWGKIRAALKIYKEMLNLDFEVDRRMMNSLLRGLCRQSRKEKELLKDAYQVFERMQSRRLVVDPVGYELVIEAFCSGKELDKALESLHEVVRIGYSPKAFTFSNVIRVLCLEGKVDKALLVFILMLKVGKSTSSVPFSLLINELNQQGKPLTACYLYGVALKSGVVPRNKPEVVYMRGNEVFNPGSVLTPLSLCAFS